MYSAKVLCTISIFKRDGLAAKSQSRVIQIFLFKIYIFKRRSDCTPPPPVCNIFDLRFSIRPKMSRVCLCVCVCLNLLSIQQKVVLHVSIVI